MPSNPVLRASVTDLPCRFDKVRAAQRDHREIAVLTGFFCGVSTLEIGACSDPGARPGANFTISPLSPSVGQEVLFTDHSSGSPTSWTWDLGDGTTSTETDPSHVYSRPGTYTVILVVANEHGSGSVSLSFEVSDPGSAPVAEFVLSTDEPSIALPVHFIDASSGRPTRWSWSFGDGYGSSDTNPSHYYSLPGAYEVSLTVANGVGSSSVSRTITVMSELEDHLPSGSSWSCLIPAAASITGAHGTRWHTDLTLHNPTDSMEWLKVYFLARGGQGNYWPPGTLINLHPHQSMTVENAVETLFGLSETSGALLIDSSWTQRAFSRTSTAHPQAGTYGQAIPAVDVYGLPRGLPGQVLIGLREDGSFRTNVGLVSLQHWELSFTIVVYSAEGLPLDQVEYSLEPYGYVHIEQLLAVLGHQGVSDAYAVVDTCCKSLQAWASVIDNRSGDAVFVPPQAMPAGSEPMTPVWVIPAVASMDGAAGTRWLSELVLLNPSELPIEVTLTLLEANGAVGSPPPQYVLDIEGGKAVHITDVVGSLFGLDQTAGALLVHSPGRLHVGSRTFNDSEEGTYGQYIPAVPPEAALVHPQQGTLLQLCQGAGFRTNLGLVNLSDQPARVRVEVFDEQGSPRGSATYEVGPLGFQQHNRALVVLTGGELDHAYAVVSPQLGDIVAYASVVDNDTGDPVFVSAIPTQP